ncbi:MAG: Erythrocyte binding protein 1, partial [Candidatus Moranbacteria bacterium GW2011_GWD2_36_198]
MKIAILYRKILEGFLCHKKPMSPRNSDKNKDVIKELEKTISPILVVNNSSLKPYVELFEYAPENIYQQPLGSLVGFFEVKEFSDESAYVVNFLTSVLKKEYYINPKRPVTESLDSALHKVNIALSELAKHGNVEWLGKINAAICVLEKNNAHFSVSGDAKIFLYRNQSLSEISEDLASDSLEPHPLKTFVNVSSGRLEKNDRMLITSADIFHILPIIEIKKNFQRFEGDKFVQFLKTALSNQIEMIASVVVEMSEVIPIAATKALPRKKSSKAVNAFSQQSFASAKDTETLAQEQENELEMTILPADAEQEYTDEKTGHIYVQGEVNENNENANPQMNLYWDMIKEKISQGSYLTKNEIRKRFSLYKKQLAKKKELRRIEKEKQQLLAAEEAKRLEEERVLQEIQHEQQIAEEQQLAKLHLEEENQRQQENLAQENILAKAEVTKKKTAAKIKVTNIDAEESESEPTADSQLSFKEKLRLARLEQQGNAVIDLKNKTTKETETFEEEIIIQPEIQFETVETISKTTKFKALALENIKKILPLSKKLIAHTKIWLSKIGAIAKNRSHVAKPNKLANIITPHFSKIGKLFSHFSGKQKLFILFALALIFIAPLFIVRFLNRPKAPTIVELQDVPLTQIGALASDKNIDFNTQVQTILSNSNIVTALIANNNPTVVTKNSVIVLQNNQPKEFPIPTDSGAAVSATYMKDLSLVLIFTDSNKILSFSPISEKFASNNIDLSNISSGSPIGTYLTYLYMLDQKNNQIYRFPRADGGFGEKTSWLKDSTSLTNVSEITIDDNIYAISDNKILKFFKGKAVDFSLESSTTPINFDKIYTTPDLQNFYALDTQNSRLVSYSKDGNIIKQYHNEALKDVISLTVDEQNKL